MKTHLLPGSILKYCYCLLSCSYGYQYRHFKRAEYNKSGTVHRIPMPVCIKDGQNLEKPIFTPYIKAEQGAYDESISPDSETRFILILFPFFPLTQSFFFFLAAK